MAIGRPPKPENADQPKYWDTDLYAFVRDRFPQFVVNNQIVIKTLADAMNLSTYRIYCVFRENRLSPKAAKTLIRLSEQNPKAKGEVVTVEDLTPFLFN